MDPEYGGHINHLSLLHQPLSLCSVQSISFLQKALLKGVLINLSETERTQVSFKAICQQETDSSSHPGAGDNLRQHIHLVVQHKDEIKNRFTPADTLYFNNNEAVSYLQVREHAQQAPQ